MDVLLRHLGVGVAHQVGQAPVADAPGGGCRPEGVAGRVHHDLLAVLVRADPRLHSQSPHPTPQGVDRPRTTSLVEEYMLAVEGSGTCLRRVAEFPQPPPQQALGGGRKVDDPGLLDLGGAAALVPADNEDMLGQPHLLPRQAAEFAGPDAGQPEEQQRLPEQSVRVPQQGQELVGGKGPFPALSIELLDPLESVRGEQGRLLLDRPTPADLHSDDGVVHRAVGQPLFDELALPLFEVEGVDVPCPSVAVEFHPPGQSVVVVLVGVRGTVKLDSIEELVAEITDGQLRVGLAVGMQPALVEQVKQGIFGGILVLPALGGLGAGAADVRTPPASVEEGLRTAWHGRFLQEETFGESVSGGGGCDLIGVGPADPLATFTVPVSPGLVWRKVANKSGRGQKRARDKEQGSPQLLVPVSLANVGATGFEPATS